MSQFPKKNSEMRWEAITATCGALAFLSRKGRNLMRRYYGMYACIALTLSPWLLLLADLPQTKEPPLLWDGIYKMRGEDGAGVYYGVVVITSLKDNTYHLVITAGQSATLGIAQSSGGALSAAWTQERVQNGKTVTVCGSTVYQKKPSGIVGYWVIRNGDGSLNREDLTLLGKLGSD